MAHAIADTLARAIDRDEQAYRKVTYRLVPFLFACYVAAYLDRVNVGFAKFQMMQDLHFSSAVYGLGAGMFFIGYFFFEVPSNLILHKVGARRWIARVMISWAVISACMVFVQSATSFYILRFLLGLAEAGLFPGVILYLTYWYPSQRRGKVIALFMTGIPISGVIGGPLSGWILAQMSDVNGLAGWQWLFLIEALPSLLLGFAVLAYLDDRIDQAGWLDADEKALLSAHIKADFDDTPSHTLRDGFTSHRVWLLCGIYFFFIIGLYGVGFWLPTLIEDAGIQGAGTIGLVTALPYAAGAVAMVWVSRHSDKTKERRWHLIVPGLIGTLGWLVSVSAAHHPTLAILCLTVATVGVMVTLSQFWCLPTAMLAGAAAAAGIAIVNSVGNLAGFFSPWAVGWIIDQTGSTALGVYALAAALGIGSLLVLSVPARLVNR